MQKSYFLKFFNLFGVFSLFFLITAVSIYFYSPVFKTNASESDNTEIGATIEVVASVSLDTNNLEFTFTPNSSGVFDSKTVTATAQTNSQNGYEMYFSSVDNNTDMVSGNASISDVISSDFSGTVTSSTMGNNKWGYSLDNTSPVDSKAFSPIPTKSNQLTLKNIDHLPTTSDERTSTVNIGVKVDNTLKASTYSKNLIFSVLAHEVAINRNRLVELTSMQDSNLSTYCAASYTPSSAATVTTNSKTFNGDIVPEATLTDIRDGNTYTVRKLADGNCWMTENLRVAGRTITSSDSDVTSNITLPAIDARSGSYGNYEYSFIGSPVAGTTNDGYNYNYHAAVAYPDGTTVEAKISPNTSICAKGWQLPNDDGAKSWGGLIESYGTITYEQASVSPFNFKSTGVKFYTGEHSAVHGFYWSRTTSEDVNFSAYSTIYTPGWDLQAHYENWRGIFSKSGGIAIRCVAR